MTNPELELERTEPPSAKTTVIFPRVPQAVIDYFKELWKHEPVGRRP